MSRRMRDLRSGVLERRAASGLGVACAEAQADGVPCTAPDCDCGSCERARAAAVPRVGTPAPGEPAQSRSP